ncbi:MAG TPA: MoaD/ThiS family protein [Chitinophagales bacterium]|nr:MoaD/ThiS family protein [Chitinophagales bacterium]
MKTKILAFGIAKEILEASSIIMDLNEGCAVNDLKNSLEEKFPRLKQLSSFRIAVNNRFASLNELIFKEDEIAIIPPVSGG